MVVPLGPTECLKTMVVYSLESSGQRVDSPNGPRFGPIATHEVFSTSIS